MIRKTIVRLSGLTLIEVLVVVAMISVVSSLTIGSISNRRQIRTLDLATREVTAALHEAQGYALQGRSSDESEDNCSFGIRMHNGDYDLIRNSGSGCATRVITAYRLPGEVEFPADLTVNFTLPRGEASANRTIRLTNGSLNRYICVYSSGRVLENGASSSCP